IQYRVWEEQPSGTRVGCLADDLRQSDEGGPFEDFQVVEHQKALPFSVSARDGVLSTQGRLDREELCRGSDLCEVLLSVLYRRSGAMTCLRVRVEVMDQNDHSPRFPRAEQDLEISEMAGLRMRIPERAVDPDAGPNGLQTYSLSVNQHFALDVAVGPEGSKQAELVIIKELDREVQESVELILVAWDKGDPPRSGSTSIHVRILDSNDNSPTFEDSSPTLELPEDTARGTTVIRLKATDPDQGLNGEVAYSLSRHTRPEVQRLLAVDPQTAAVSLKAPLDYEVQSSYEVVVEARDRGPNAVPAYCKLHIKLLDVNDNAPRILFIWDRPGSPGPTVLEGAPRDTFLSLVMVLDADSGRNGQVKAEILDGSGPFRLKHVQDGSYTIVTNGTLDREKVTHYNITLLARDHGDPPLSTLGQLTVHVLDENDNAPVFSTSLYKASFEETNSTGYQVLKVQARDVDLELSGRVSYFIRNATRAQAATYFSVHPTSGLVRALRPLDYETSRSYWFLVEAVDQGHPPLSSTATVQIEIRDVNDNYPVVKEPAPRRGVASLSIPVNADKEGRAAFLVSTIQAEDADSGLNGQLTYQLTRAEPNPLFWLDAATGQLFVNTTNATQLIGQTFRLDISVSDGGRPSLSTGLTLEVTFINLRDHLKNSSPGARGQLSFAMMMAICLGATCLLLLLTVALVTTLCRPEKRDNRAYNCRQAESTYTRHPRRPQKNIRKSDIQLIPVIRSRTLRLQAQPDGAEAPSPGQATLRRPRNSQRRGNEAERQRMLRDLVRLSMAAFGDSIQLSSTSPEVQQISQLLSLLRQGQLQPRTNFRGNKYSHRRSVYGGQDCSDWQSAKDSGRGESEAGDVDWEPGRDSPQLDEGLNHLLNHPDLKMDAAQTLLTPPLPADGFLPDAGDPAWMARLSLPLAADYHDNVFIPNGPPSPEDAFLPRDVLDSSSSFSTFGKTPEKDGPLGGALLSEVSTLFEMLMTQKADAH
uniref:Protocadherin 12 n=1 Tax=Tetraodon nigroviridis TaxID=99883 RepID=H3D607_TETNG